MLKNKDVNNIIIGVLSIVLFLAPLLVFPHIIAFDFGTPTVMRFDINTPKVIVMYVSAILLIILLVMKRKELVFDKKDILILIFLMLILISTVFSINKLKSLLGEEYRHEGLFMIITYILVYFFTKYYFKEYKYFYTMLFGLVVFICIIAICQFYDIFVLKKILGIYIHRAQYFTDSTFGNPNFLGSYITIFLPIFMSLYVLQGKKRYLLIAGIVFCAMLCTLTRSSWVAFALYSIIGIVYIMYKKEKKLIKNGLILFSAFLILFVVGDILSGGRIVGRNINMINEMKNAATEGIRGSMGSGRIEIWKVTLNQIKMHPWLGTGVDTLKDAIIHDQNEYYKDRLERIGNYIDKAHNEYLQIAATMGIPSLLIYLLFIFFILKDNAKNIFKDKVTFILLLSIIGYLIQAFFNISTIGVAPVFWMILGLIQNEEFKKSVLNRLV